MNEYLPEPPVYTLHRSRNASEHRPQCFVPSSVIWGARFFEPPTGLRGNIRPYTDIAYLGYDEHVAVVTVLSKPRVTRHIQGQVLVQVQGEAYPRNISVERLRAWIEKSPAAKKAKKT